MKEQRLMEEKPAQRFGVNRQPACAALIQLAKDKLIIKKNRKGTFVSFS